MIKNFKIELIVLAILVLNIFVAYNIDMGFYNLFKNFDGSLQHIYLKKFFIQITILGDSKWYFIIAVFVILVGFFLRGNSRFINYRRIIDAKISISIFLFFSLLTTGILTQILKHIVGRPRPNHAVIDENIGFNFFSLSSEFHSFPSGHSSTIFAVALVALYFIPKTKYFAIFFASLVAFSRVVVGAHFFTDVIGGIAIAYIGTKIAKILLEKYGLVQFNKTKEYISDYISGELVLNRFFTAKIYFSFLLSFVLILFLSIGHSIEIYLSGLFYFGKGQFLLQSYYDITVFFRKIVLRLIVIYIFLLPAISFLIPIKRLYFNYNIKFKDIVFLWVSSIANLILVNIFLKGLWGRARPGEILQLGGSENFTPWYQISTACNNNCSFVSGDAAVGFSLIVFYFITKNEMYFWLSLFFGFILGVIRVMEGGHFVSDVIMAGVVIFSSYLLQTSYYLKKYGKN